MKLPVFLQGTPDDRVHSKIKQTLLAIDTVGEVHHMHFCSLDGENHVLTAYLVLK
ncbi:MAG: cobalt-zinc-cadmium efflux system protein [Paraglaciecola sp.]